MKNKHYSFFQVILHWSMAILFAVNYIFSDEMRSFFHRHLDGVATSNDRAVTFHIFVGITFILFAVIRLAIRTNHNTPEMAATSGSILMKLESYIHHGLYLLMFLIPIAGMSALYAKIEILGKIHVLLMNLMLAIIVFHIIAGLYHQFILKDNLLIRMSIFKR